MRYLLALALFTLAGCYSNDCERRCAAIADLWTDCEDAWADDSLVLQCYAEGDYLPTNDGGVVLNAEAEACDSWSDVFDDCQSRIGELQDGDEVWCYATTPPEARDNAECVQLAWYASGMMGNL